MDEILKEQGFQQSGCTNEMCAVEAGQLLGVQKMLSGSVGKFGKLFTIELQIIDIETSQIEKSSTYYYEGEMEQLLTEGIKLSLEKLIGTKQEITSNNEKEQVDINHESDIIKQELEFGYITFKIAPSNANIKFDNKSISTQNRDDYKISVGTYDLQISKKGYKKYTDVISINSGDKLVIEKTLEPDEKPKKLNQGSSPVSLYINGGFIEPWGDPGTGALFNMGTKVQGGVQLNIGNWIDLPVFLKPLTAEVMIGYGNFNIKSEIANAVPVYNDAKTNVISVLTLGRYDITDLILNLIGIETPALGIFGVAGFQYNTQSWDFPNWFLNGEFREFDSASSFGLNLGLGVKYNLQNVVGRPVEVDLRFTQGVFIMGDVMDQNGDPMFLDKYNHTENGLLFGLKYPL